MKKPKSSLTKTQMREKLTVMVEPGLIERAKAVAKAEDRSLSSWLRLLIEREVQRAERKIIS